MAIRKKSAKRKPARKALKKPAKKAPKRLAKKVSKKKISTAKQSARRALSPKKRSAAKLKAKPKTRKKAIVKKSSGPKPIGQVTHFYGEIKVAVVRFSQPVKQGTEIHFKGATTDFVQRLESMQYDHKPLAKAPKGKQVGVKVKSRVRQGDQVYPG